MIPPFNEHGYLPPGIHRASLDPSADEELRAGLPFLEIQVVEDEGFEFLVQRFFATDRDSVPKGMVEVIL